jgi:hypothetical protein
LIFTLGNLAYFSLAKEAVESEKTSARIVTIAGETFLRELI